MVVAPLRLAIDDHRSIGDGSVLYLRFYHQLQMERYFGGQHHFGIGSEIYLAKADLTVRLCAYPQVEMYETQTVCASLPAIHMKACKLSTKKRIGRLAR